MRPPPFWYDRRGTLAWLLAPFGGLYTLAGTWRRKRADPWRCGIPVLCVGNVTAGGTGKTPVAIDLARRLLARGETPHILVRGYGGRIKGPHRVNPDADTAGIVGDEALLLARSAPVWVGGDRAASARHARAAGATTIVMDDGFQNAALAKDCSLLVVDAAVGIGNGLAIPAGPLRESWSDAARRAQAVVLMGAGVPDDARFELRHPDLSLVDGPVLPARLASDPARIASVRGSRIVAFAGIGRPHKFFDSLRAAGAELAEAIPFPDHYAYKPRDLRALAELADRLDAPLWTTEKDHVRLPSPIREQVTPLAVTVAWDAPESVDRLLDDLLQARDTARPPIGAHGVDPKRDRG